MHVHVENTQCPKCRAYGVDLHAEGTKVVLRHPSCGHHATLGPIAGLPATSRLRAALDR